MMRTATGWLLESMDELLSFYVGRQRCSNEFRRDGRNDLNSPLIEERGYASHDKD